jgi:hypothetical protein
MKFIVYTKQDGGVSVIYPAFEYIDKIEMIADKDVPSGFYYKILNISDLPPRKTRNAWESNLDSSNSDGIGLTKEEFEIKYPEYKGMAVQ